MTDTLAEMAADPIRLPGVVAASEARDRARFEEEALTHAEQLYRIARSPDRGRQVAEDLVQETYLRAFRAWRSYRPGTNLAAWLATIMRNANLDELRRQSRRPVQEPLDDDGDYYLYNRLAQASPQPQDEVLARLSGTAIVSALGDLPQNFREVVVLVDVGDFTYADAAGILGIPIGTVMSRLYRGRRLLKRALAELRRQRGGGMSADPCHGAESMLQPYLDRVLTEAEVGAHRRAPARVQLLQRPLRVRAQPARGRQGVLLRRAGAGRVRRAAAAALLGQGA